MAGIVSNAGTAHLGQMMDNIMYACIAIGSRSKENSNDVNNIIECMNSICVNYAHSAAVQADNRQKQNPKT